MTIGVTNGWIGARGLVLACGLGAGLLAPWAAAQDAPTDPPVPAAEEAQTTDRPMPDLNQLAADALARAAILWLREVEEPTIEDYRITALALRVAQRLRPDDEELVRLELQAWTAAGDDARMLELTERIVRLDPRDTVAQLRLLTTRLRNLQDAAKRLAAYERLLGDAGASLDAAIRSRLALDAALLARETGDEAVFIERLTQAATLDSTNKEAAALYSTYFLDRVESARERAELLANVILADPIDSNAHTNLARELFRRGAFAAAKRFFDRAGDVQQSVGTEPNLDDLFERYLLTWMNEGDEACAAVIMLLQKKGESQLIQMRKQMERQGIDPGEMPEPLIPAEIEIIRLGIAFGRGEREAAAEASRRINDRLDEQLRAFEERQPPYENLTDDQVEAYRRKSELDRLVARLWSGSQLDEAWASFERLSETGSIENLEPRAIERMRGWLGVRWGEAAWAMNAAGLATSGAWGYAPLPTTGAAAIFSDAAAWLEPLAQDDPLARLGLGVLGELRGDRRGALRAYAALALEQAHRLVGCAARRRIEVMRGEPLAPTAEAADLNEWAKSFAPWLDEMTTNPAAFMTITASHTKPRIDAFDHAELLVSLRNNSRLPMAVGPEHTFNSRLLLTPKLVVKGEDVSALVPPEPLEMDRRLRLMPGDRIEVKTWVGRGTLGMWLDRFSTKTASVRWRVIQGYRIDQDRRFAPGAVSVTSQSDMMTRDSIGAEATAEEIVAALETAKGRLLLEWTLRAMAQGATIIPREGEEANRLRRLLLAEAVAKQLPRMSDLERTWAIATAAYGGLVKDTKVILEASRQTTSPYVRAIMMLATIFEADDPSLPVWAEDVDPEIREMASLMRTRLADRGSEGLVDSAREPRGGLDAVPPPSEQAGQEPVDTLEPAEAQP